MASLIICKKKVSNLIETKHKKIRITDSIRSDWIIAILNPTSWCYWTPMSAISIFTIFKY